MEFMDVLRLLVLPALAFIAATQFHLRVKVAGMQKELEARKPACAGRERWITKIDAAGRKATTDIATLTERSGKELK